MVSYSKEIIFLAKFFAIFFTAEFLINTFRAPMLENFLSGSVAQILGLQSFGNLIFVTTGAFEITPSCTGLVGASILGAIIFSLKKPQIKQKISVFIAGTLLLFVLNYLRLILVVLAGKYHGLEVAEIVHVVSWFSTAIFVLLIWYEFTKKLTGVKNFSGFFSALRLSA